MKSEILKGALKRAYDENTNTRSIDIQSWVANIAYAISQQKHTSIYDNLQIIDSFLKSISDYEHDIADKRKKIPQPSIEALSKDIVLYKKGRKSMKEICDCHGITQDTFYKFV